ncbi:MAG: polyphosphate polymerase domain-containing protein [Clostridia bacterium]|nr:polyphosphate polymerase domain-containing protein [Clostridia bacterium]
MFVVNFERIEKKYRLSEEKTEQLLLKIGQRLIPDEHGKSLVCNAYLDTADYRMIRASIDAVDYKEKLRIRSYGVPGANSTVFLELKKKYSGVVYKRREAMRLSEAMILIKTGIRPFESQIISELDAALSRNGRPLPAALIYYEREAYYAADDPSLRITFDRDIVCLFGSPGFDDVRPKSKVLPSGSVLMEIKVGGAMPLWLTHALSDLSVYPSTFSKYGTAFINEQKKHSITLMEEA